MRSVHESTMPGAELGVGMLECATCAEMDLSNMRGRRALVWEKNKKEEEKETKQRGGVWLMGAASATSSTDGRELSTKTRKLAHTGDASDVGGNGHCPILRCR